MTKAQEMLELHKAGLEQLLAALHAGDPNRELYVRVGDLMRETDALLRLAAQAEAPGGQPQSPLDPCPYAIDGCVLENDEIGPCLCANAVSRPLREGK
jgi:hypothetical protein